MVTGETLSSGLRLVTERMPHVRSVTVGVWLTRGSRHASDQESGVAHFVEHMLFKGDVEIGATTSRRRSTRSAGTSTRSRRRNTPATTSKSSTSIWTWRSIS
jgi:predicted Zn-dependent peptidase